MSVLQSGSITPGHAASWVTEGVIKDAGALPASQRVLASLNADFSDTGDQALIIPAAITAFMLSGIVVTNSVASLTVAQGGFYPRAGKAGTAIVAAGQIYSALTGATVLLSATLTASALATRYSVATLPDWKIYLSLTVGQGILAPADVYIIGVDLTL